MLGITLAGLRAHRLRLLLTTVAIMLGVGFIAGTFVLTDTMQAGIDREFAGSAGKADLVALSPEFDGESQLAAGHLARVRALPGVADAQGLVRGEAALIGKDGKAHGAMPTLGLSVPAGRLLRYEFRQGRAPAAPNEAVLDEQTAEKTGFEPGATLRVLDHRGTVHTFALVGVADFGIDQGVAVQGAVGFDTATALRMTGEQSFHEIDIAAAEGAAGLHAAVAGAVGKEFEVLTGEELGERLARSAGADTRMIGVGLLMFGLVSLLVSALVIYNTFTILIAQRMRELALLRCVGASRRQVFGGVLVESAVVGLVGSLLGLALGYGLGVGLLALVGLMDTGLPTGAGGIALHPRTVVLGLAVGVVVTVLAALVPARTATRVAPVAALRSESEPGTGRFRLGRVRLALAVVFGAAGVAIGALGSLGMEKGESAMFVVAFGGVPAFLAVIMIMPLLVRPLSRAIGAVFARPAGMPGELAVENARRAPRRTATTTIALTVGVGLMSLFSVVAGSVEATTERQLAEQFPVDYQLGPQIGTDHLIPRALAAELRRKPELASVTEVREKPTKVDGTDFAVAAVSAAALGRQIRPEVEQGSLAALTGDTVAVHQTMAGHAGKRLGDEVKVRTARGVVQLEIVAILAGDLPLPPYLVSEADFDRHFGPLDDSSVYVVIKDGVPEPAARAVVDAAARPYPTVKVYSTVEFQEELGGAVNTLMLVFGGLLGLAIVIALFGIANTMTLSVVERTRESALLRALGLTRRQLRRMLTVEALIMGVIGALTGVVLGVVFGWASTNAISKNFVFAPPYLWIAGFVVLAGLAGMLAGVLPARRASRASIVESLAHE
ncbi:ABC transporter permease [Actinomadura craniellae]|uniref:ABC transporter permease n=1 Tax=Actinomadura craniellae TaxID=2231787 RepID=A0A365H8I9_9ACTN|nr:FtsX-like permease family protein [Actinomadura craniellae]RAY15349.1 ABC transporter permease [Actinomadura craniellae]